MWFSYNFRSGVLNPVTIIRTAGTPCFSVITVSVATESGVLHQLPHQPAGGLSQNNKVLNKLGLEFRWRCVFHLLRLNRLIYTPTAALIMYRSSEVLQIHSANWKLLDRREPMKYIELMVWNLMYDFTCRLVWLWDLFFRPKERTFKQ